MSEKCKKNFKILNIWNTLIINWYYGAIVYIYARLCEYVMYHAKPRSILMENNRKIFVVVNNNLSEWLRLGTKNKTTGKPNNICEREREEYRPFHSHQVVCRTQMTVNWPFVNDRFNVYPFLFHGSLLSPEVILIIPINRDKMVVEYSILSWIKNKIT